MKQWHWDARHPGMVEHENGAWVLVTDAANAVNEARDVALVAAATMLTHTANLSADALRLKYEEMTAQEIRTLRAVLEQQADAITRMAGVSIGDDEGDNDAE